MPLFPHFLFVFNIMRSKTWKKNTFPINKHPKVAIILESINFIGNVPDSRWAYTFDSQEILAVNRY